MVTNNDYILDNRNQNNRSNTKMNKKEIIIDVMNNTAEVKIETKGYTGMKCVEESQFLKEALGVQMEQTLHPIAYQKDKESIREYKTICG